MLKKKVLFITIIMMVITLSSCSVVKPLTATCNPIGTKIGISKGTKYFGFFWSHSDISIRKAAENGGITKISTVDTKRSGFLGIIVTYETIVTGE